MFSRIIAFIMSVFAFLTAPFSQAITKTELKNELKKGNYESPYIVTGIIKHTGLERTPTDIC